MSAPNLIRIAPGDVIDDFEISEILAESSSSATFRATHRTLEREVVLKFVYPAVFSDETEAIDAARADASRVARLEHPGIAAVFGAGTYEGGLYVASALPKGRTLTELGVDREITPEQAARVLCDVAAALQDAHEHGVIHRDLRPDCITVDRWGHAVVRDFGVTRTSGRTSHVTRAEMLSTLRFTAPELVLGRDATPATDVYGLAAVAVWCLTGAPPYRDRSPADYIQVVTEAPPPILVDAHAAPATEINRVIAAAMALDPAVRPPAAEFAASLEKAVARLPADLRAQGSPLAATEAPLTSPALRDASVALPGPRDATRVEHRRPLPAPEAGPAASVPWTTWMACVMVAVTAGFAGFFVGGVTAPEAVPPVSLGPFRLVLGDSWQQVGPASGGGVRLKGVAGVAGVAGGTATLRLADDVRLPGDPVSAAILGDPKAVPRHVVSAGTQLVTYATREALVVARPTTRGTLIASCSKGTPPGRCAGLVVRAEGPAKNETVTPVKDVSQQVAAAMVTIQQNVGLTAGDLRDAHKRSDAATTLANALQQVGESLAAKGGDPGTAAVLAHLSKAIGAAGVAADALATAIDRESKPAIRAAEKIIRESELEVERTLKRLKRAGYEVAG